MSERDTICALASGALPSAISIIRVSGPAVRDIAEEQLSTGLPHPRVSVLTTFNDQAGAPVDEGLALYFASPASYTGEDTLELFLHGGRAVVEHALEALTSRDGVRLAEPGEFTRRAFETGKLDLTEAEGVADLIEAETKAQKAQALRQLSGGLSEVYDGWRAELTGLLALVEVAIDFPDEGDAPQDTDAPVILKLDALIAELRDALGDKGIGEKIRDGFRVAIIGPPNAGKSTLLNRLAGRDAAIVTPTAGTTRDVIEVRKVMGGHIVWFADTAGLRETSDEIEAEGVRRAHNTAKDADLRLFLVSPDCPNLAQESLPYRVTTDIVVVNKMDLSVNHAPGDGELHISAQDGTNVDILEQKIAAFIQSRASAVEAPVITRARHRDKISSGLDALLSARGNLIDGIGAELAAEDLRMTLRHLGSIVGHVGVEDILGAVFSEFCIGK